MKMTEVSDNRQTRAVMAGRRSITADEIRMLAHEARREERGRCLKNSSDVGQRRRPVAIRRDWCGGSPAGMRMSHDETFA